MAAFNYIWLGRQIRPYSDGKGKFDFVKGCFRPLDAKNGESSISPDIFYTFFVKFQGEKFQIKKYENELYMSYYPYNWIREQSVNRYDKIDYEVLMAQWPEFEENLQSKFLFSIIEENGLRTNIRRRLRKNSYRN